MPMSVGEFKLFVEPGLNNIWFDAIENAPPIYSQVVNVRDHDGKITLQDAKWAGLGQLQEIAEGDDVVYDTAIAPVTRDYTYSTYGLGYQITKRMMDGDLYNETEKLEKNLRKRAVDDQERSAASIFNSGFDTTVSAGFDGLALFSTSHTRLDGGSTQGNRPSTDEALSLAALHNALIEGDKWVDDRGQPTMIDPRQLVFPPDLQMVAAEILESSLKPGTANNDKNVVTRFGLEPVKWKYLTSTTAWFLLYNEHDVNFNWYERPTANMDTEFDSRTIKRAIWQGYSFGHGEWIGTWGTDGVA